MKKLLLTLFAIATTLSTAFAQVVTLDFTDTEQLSSCGVTAPSSGSVKIANGKVFTVGDFSFTSKTGGNRIFMSTNEAAPGLEFRGFKKANLVFSAAEGKVIKNIKFVGANLANDYTVDNGLFYTGENQGNFHTATWMGETNEFTLVCSGGPISITKMVVTLGAPSAVAVPKIAPNGGTFYNGVDAPVTVTLQSAAEGAKVMYKTSFDGEYQEYTSALSLTESSFVIAKSVLGAEESAEVGAKFNVVATTEVASIAEYNALEKGAVALFTCPLYVCHQQADAYGKYIVVTDGTGYAVLHGDAGVIVKNGDKFPAGVAGTVAVGSDSYYNRTLEVIAKTLQDVTASHAIAPKTVTAVEVSSLPEGAYVYLKNVTATSTGSWDATLSDATGTVAAYDLMSTFPKSFAGAYNIIGVVADVYGEMKVYPISFEAAESSFTFFDFSNTTQFGVEAPASGKSYDVPNGTVYTLDGVSFTSVKKGSTATRFYNSTAKATPGIELRVYKNAEFKFTAPEGMAIKKIIFKASTYNAPTIDCGVLAAGTKKDGFFDVVWMGDDSEITFNTVGNFFIKSAIIYVAPQSAVRYPAFTPAAETFIDGINTPAKVVIASATEGATIKYRLEGETEYAEIANNGEVSVDAPTTIYAKAVKDGAESAEMSYKVTILYPEAVASSTELLSKNNNWVVRLTTPVVVNHQQNDAYGKYLFVTDGAKSFVIKGITDTYAKGDVLAAGIVGTVSTGDYSLSKVLVAFAETVVKSDVTEAKPVKATTQEILNDVATYNYEYVIMYDVKVTNASAVYNYTLTDKAGSINAYDQFSTVPSTLPTEDCDVLAIALDQFGMMVWPIEIAKASGVEGVTNLNGVVLGANGVITVVAPEATSVVVYSANGQLVSQSQVVEGATSIAAAAGMYIVKMGNQVTKVVVK